MVDYLYTNYLYVNNFSKKVRKKMALFFELPREFLFFLLAGYRKKTEMKFKNIYL